jgi:hypothetical protein
VQARARDSINDGRGDCDAGEGETCETRAGEEGDEEAHDHRGPAHIGGCRQADGCADQDGQAGNGASDDGQGPRDVGDFVAAEDE